MILSKQSIKQYNTFKTLIKFTKKYKLNKNVTLKSDSIELLKDL